MTDPIDAALEVAPVLEALGIPYLIGGSVASTLYGEPRATLDVDFVVHLDEGQAEALADALEGAFCLDRELMVAAVREERGFNLIDLKRMVKVDVYVRGRGGIHGSEIDRALTVRLREGAPEARVASPEDTILQKLRWYREGGEVSDRQRRDVLGVLKAMRGRLDEEYLSRWARELGLQDLLESLQRESSGP